MVLGNSTKSLIVFIFLCVHQPSLSWIGWHRRPCSADSQLLYFISGKWRDIFISLSSNGIFFHQTEWGNQQGINLYFNYISQKYFAFAELEPNPELSWFYKLHYENLELFRHKIVNNFIVVSSSSSIQYNIPNVSPSIAMYWKDS